MDRCYGKKKEIIMKHRLLLIVLLTMFFPLCFEIGIPATQSFGFETPLKTLEASPSEIKGTFTLILYGGNYSDDIETFAILDMEGDRYDFDLFAPDFDYRVTKGVPAEKVLSTAEKFVSFHPAFWRTQLSKILDRAGDIVGFELRPLYRPEVFGFSDILEVNYWPKENGKIKVTIRLVSPLERLKIHGFDGGPGGSN
jgi:hypothetical protein